MKLLKTFLPAIFSVVASKKGSDLQAEIIEAFERDIQEGLNTVERKTSEMGRDQHQWDKPQPFHRYR